MGSRSKRHLHPLASHWLSATLHYTGCAIFRVRYALLRNSFALLISIYFSRIPTSIENVGNKCTNNVISLRKKPKRGPKPPAQYSPTTPPHGPPPIDRDPNDTGTSWLNTPRFLSLNGDLTEYERVIPHDCRSLSVFGRARLFFARICLDLFAFVHLSFVMSFSV
jgi:hypothetical protein